jgi:heme A synthase
VTSISIAVAVAILTFGSGLLGLYLQKRLPQTHLSGGSKDMILAVIGLLTLLLALVLGTLVGNTYAFFAMQKSELETMASRALLVDQALAEYGPEAKPARSLMKQALTQSYDLFWRGADADPASRSLSTVGSRSRTRSVGSIPRRRLRRMHSPRPKPISR